jgi:hypothetical protein
MESIVSLEIHAILIETLGEHSPPYATVKNWVAQFKRGDFSTLFSPGRSGFGGPVVSMQASGTRVRGFTPDRSRWIFRATEKSSAYLPSEGK